MVGPLSTQLKVVPNHRRPRPYTDVVTDKEVIASDVCGTILRAIGANVIGINDVLAKRFQNLEGQRGGEVYENLTVDATAPGRIKDITNTANFTSENSRVSISKHNASFASRSQLLHGFLGTHPPFCNRPRLHRLVANVQTMQHNAPALKRGRVYHDKEAAGVGMDHGDVVNFDTQAFAITLGERQVSGNGSATPAVAFYRGAANQDEAVTFGDLVVG